MNPSVPPCRRIASNLLWTPEGIVRNPLVEVAADGRILRVEVCPEPDRQPGTEFYAGLLAPGLVNAHCHLELSRLRGILSEGTGLAGFAHAMRAARRSGGATGRMAYGLSAGDSESLGADVSPARAATTGPGAESVETALLHAADEAVDAALNTFHAAALRAADAADAAMWAAGVQAVGDTANTALAFPVKERSRIAYRTFVECYGLRTRSADALRPLLAYPGTSLTPHSLYTVQDGLFRQIAAEGDATLSIHFLESAEERDLYRLRGALWEWYGEQGLTCDFLGYGSPARRLVESVPKERSVVLVHDCCVTQRDIDLIMEHFTAPVFWCLCPRSNRYISRVAPPIELLRRNGLTICLGTDSLASNSDLSLFEELRCLDEVPLPELLAWATANGAAALGMSDRAGRIAPGLTPGLVVLSGIDYATLRLTPSSRIRRIL